MAHHQQPALAAELHLSVNPALAQFDRQCRRVSPSPPVSFSLSDERAIFEARSRLVIERARRSLA